jgi:ABC-type multidrug transport system ATPase subunit
MKRIAESGRAVCATIHQPSIAIFQSFDSLLLLKRGGETVFYGELGDESCKLIEYLERYDATQKIQPGENPATWMLTTIGAGSASTDKKPFDYAGSYAQSKLHAKCLELIDKICAGATDDNRVSFPSKYATSRGKQARAVMRRTLKVYFRYVQLLD